jgi:hypothetical protein
MDLFQIGVVVVIAFAVNLWPFLSWAQLGEVLTRIFPIGRGLYEDKVTRASAPPRADAARRWPTSGARCQSLSSSETCWTRRCLCA